MTSRAFGRTRGAAGRASAGVLSVRRNHQRSRQRSREQVRSSHGHKYEDSSITSTQARFTEPREQMRRRSLIIKQPVLGLCVHWRRPGPDRALTGSNVQGRVKSRSWLRATTAGADNESLLDALERRWAEQVHIPDRRAAEQQARRRACRLPSHASQHQAEVTDKSPTNTVPTNPTADQADRSKTSKQPLRMRPRTLSSRATGRARRRTRRRALRCRTHIALQ